MSLIGLSTLYLLLAGESFEKVPTEIAADRPSQPELWEVVDEGEHALTKARLELLKMLEAVGYRFTVHAPFKEVDIAHPDRGRRLEAVRRLKNCIEAAADLEARSIVIHPGVRRPGLEQVSFEALAEVADHAASLGLPCAIENMIPSSGRPSQMFLSTPEEFLEFYRATGSRAGVVFDAGHAHIGGLVDAFLRELVDRFILVHASDNGGGFDEHLRIGRGTIGWQNIVSHLKKVSFIGPYVVESVKEPFDSVAELRRIVEAAKP